MNGDNSRVYWLVECDRNTRFRKVISSVIGEVQMAFIRNRQILDSFVIAEEIIHHRKKRGNMGLLVKLDFEKAYDSLDHAFLDSMLEEMGFGGKRRKAGDLNLIKGVVLSLEAVHFSNFQFANDTIVFLQPNMEYLMNARRILRCFELASGLRLNFHNSCVLRIGKTGGREDSWATNFICTKASLPISYLDLPLGGHSGSKIFWDNLIWHLENRLRPWKKKFLNKGGRLVLIKNVMSSILVYYMSVFKIPVCVGQKIERHQRNFFWGDGEERKKIHAIKWDLMCKSKAKGCLALARSSTRTLVFLPSRLRKILLINSFFCVSGRGIFDRDESRNNKIFKDVGVDINQAEDMVRFRVAWWFKNLGKGSSDPFMHILLNIEERCTNLSCIGGVLRDHRGKVLCIFSVGVGIQDAVSVEILAITRACKLCGSMQDLVLKPIVIVSDSMMAVSWINNSGLGSLKHVQTIYDICSGLISLGVALVVFSSRAFNTFVDLLAKKGLLMMDMCSFGASFEFFRVYVFISLFLLH
ncbi:hypothetical protein Ddye_015925 [Dipteronia dyeriana]|uniref:RNase H type-1 domain-containing protein n=1 Tax=Dipteronia dyeriana TaxID=168575 RepID=A0AAD9WYZ6_9ROSI|nr:hypothetical protein Ddye_015925 [Dipteronia dyeriana]